MYCVEGAGVVDSGSLKNAIHEDKKKATGGPVACERCEWQMAYAFAAL